MVKRFAADGKGKGRARSREALFTQRIEEGRDGLQ